MHKYTSYSVSKVELLEFEQAIGVKLPDDYRNFLIEVGYGAGPYYGLFSLTEIKSDIDGVYPVDYFFRPIEWLFWILDLRKKSPAQENKQRRELYQPTNPFPYNYRIAEEVHERIAEGIEEPCEVGTQQCYGCIRIGHQGCTDYTFLVVTGELRGSVWEAYFDTEIMWCPARTAPCFIIDRNLGVLNKPKPFVPELSKVPTFIEWYDAWLNGCIENMSRLKNKK